MYVIFETQLPVAVNPGSNVNMPDFAYRVRISIIFGPAVPSRISSSISVPSGKVSLHLSTGAGTSGLSFLVASLDLSDEIFLSFGFSVVLYK